MKKETGKIFIQKCAWLFEKKNQQHKSRPRRTEKAAQSLEIICVTDSCLEILTNGLNIF